MSCPKSSSCYAKSSSYNNYYKPKEVPVYEGACGGCGCAPCESDCAVCPSESKCLAVSKRVLAACPPSAARDLLPCYCNCQAALGLPTVYYNFEIEILNQSEETITLQNILDSLVAGGFCATWSVGKTLLGLRYNVDGTVKTYGPIDITTMDGDLLPDLITEGFDGDLMPCARLVVQLYVAGEQQAYCITKLAQEVSVVALATGGDILRRTAAACIPL